MFASTVKSLLLELAILSAIVTARPSQVVRSSSCTETIIDVVLASTSDGGKGFDDKFDNFNILAHLVVLANLTEPLSDKDADLTVFAPPDAAFLATAKSLEKALLPRRTC
jgi:uncharacterized surface protein with fasciclin (FAS1) repeats